MSTTIGERCPKVEQQDQSCMGQAIFATVTTSQQTKACTNAAPKNKDGNGKNPTIYSQAVGHSWLSFGMRAVKQKVRVTTGTNVQHKRVPEKSREVKPIL